MPTVEKTTEKVPNMKSLAKDAGIQQYGEMKVILPANEDKGAVFSMPNALDSISVVSRERDEYGRSVKETSVDKSPAGFVSAFIANYQKQQHQLGKMLSLESAGALTAPRTTAEGKETAYETNNLAGNAVLKSADGKEYRVSIIKHQSKDFKESRDTFVEQAMAERAYGKGAKLHNEKVQSASFEIVIQEKGADGLYSKDTQRRLTVYAEQDREGNLVQHSNKDREGNLTQTAFTFKDARDPKVMDSIGVLGDLIKDNYGYKPQDGQKRYEVAGPDINFRVMNHADLSREIAKKALEITENTNRQYGFESGDKGALISSRLDGKSSIIVPALGGKEQTNFSFENRVMRLGEGGKLDLEAYGKMLQEINASLPKAAEKDADKGKTVEAGKEADKATGRSGRSGAKKKDKESER